MMSIKVNSHRRHAVLFEGKKNDEYRFLSNRRKDSIESDYYTFKREELEERLVSLTLVGYMASIENPIPMDISNELKVSLDYLKDYRKKLIDFCSQRQSVESLNEARDLLFAPLMLDVLSMMEIIEETDLVKDIKLTRSTYMSLMKEQRPLCVANERLDDIISTYKKVIETYYQEYKNNILL